MKRTCEKFFYRVYLPGLPEPWSHWLGTPLFILTGVFIVYLVYCVAVILPLLVFIKPLSRLKAPLKGRIRWFPVPWVLKGEFQGQQIGISLSSAFLDCSSSDVYINFDLHKDFSNEITVAWRDDVDIELLEKQEIHYVPIEKKYHVRAKDFNYALTILNDGENRKLLDELLLGYSFHKIHFGSHWVRLFKKTSYFVKRYSSVLDTFFVEAVLARLCHLAKRII